MPKKKDPPRSREEQERAFKAAAKASGADESGMSFEAAIKRIVSKPAVRAVAIPRKR